jgi:hypothetical protein
MAWCSVKKDDQIREDEIGGTFSTHGKMRNGYKISFGILEEKDHLGELNLDGILKKVGCEDQN